MSSASTFELDKGNFSLSYTGQFPDKLKLIKTVVVHPFEITAIGSLDPRSRKWNYSIGCRDTLIHGKVTYNATKKAVEYRKVLPLPVFGGLTRPVIAAEWQVGASWRSPRVQLGLAVDDTSSSSTDDGATLSPDGKVAFRKKAFVTRRWGVEVDGDLRFQLQHDLTGSSSTLESFGLQLAARELNLVCRI